MRQPRCVVAHPCSREASVPSPALPLLLPLLLSPPAAAEDLHPPGATIENAVVVDITPQGFEAILALIPGLLPTGLEIPEIGDEYEGLGGVCVLGGYAYSLSGGWVDVSIVDASLVPQSGYLALSADLQVQVNSPSDPMALYYELECLGDTCDGYVDPFNASLETTIAMRIVEVGGVPTLDAQIGTIDVSYDLSGEDIHLDGCVLGTIEDILNWFGLSLFDLVLGLVEGELQSAVADFGPEIEAVLEEAFSAAAIQQEIDLAGVTAELELYPGDVQIEPQGMRLAMDGSMDTSAASPCVDAYDPGGSLATFTAPPSIASTPTGVTPGYHAGILLSDDFGNQLLYSVWRGGLLCYSLAPGDDTLPISLDTSLLGLLAGDAFDDLFPDAKPMQIEVRPKVAPTMVYDSDNDVAVHVEELGLEFYGELDHRQALVVGIDLETDAGIDLDLDGATGNLAILVDIAGEDVVPTVTDNEFAPDANADIETSFSGVFDTLVGSVLGGLTGDLAFALPAIEGLGLTSLQFAPTGAEEDWLGAYATLGPVTYESGGCDEGGGCDMGCASGSRAPGSGWLVLGIPLALAGLRRRPETRA